MTRAAEKYTNKEWQGRVVRTVRVIPLTTRTIASGTRLTVARVANNLFTLKTEPCPCCGMNMQIRNVPVEYFQAVTAAGTIDILPDVLRQHPS